MLNIPVVVALEMLLFGRSYPSRILVTLACATVGIGMAIGQEVRLNVVGGTFAILSAVCVALCTIVSGCGAENMELMLMCFFSVFEEKCTRRRRKQRNAHARSAV